MSLHVRHALLCVLSLCCGFTSSAVSAGEGKVFYAEDYNKDHNDVKAYFGTQAMGTIIKATVFAKDRPTIERMAKRLGATLTRHEDITTVHKPGPMTTLNAH